MTMRPEPRQPELDPDWPYRAACDGHDPNLWFPSSTTGRSTRDVYEQARQICHRCPVLEECTQAALHEERKQTLQNRFGMRGGLTPAERLLVERSRA